MTKFYTVDQASEILGVSLDTIAWHVRHDELDRTEQGITAESLEARRRISDPQLDQWCEIYLTFLATDGADLTVHAQRQLAVVLVNRIKDHGHKRGQESANELGVSRARVSQLLQQAKALYKPSL